MFKQEVKTRSEGRLALPTTKELRSSMRATLRPSEDSSSIGLGACHEPCLLKACHHLYCHAQDQTSNRSLMDMLDPQRRAMLSQPRKLGNMLQSLEVSLLSEIARVSGQRSGYVPMGNAGEGAVLFCGDPLPNSHTDR